MVLLALLAVVLLVVSCGGERASSAPRPGWTVLHDRTHGLTVRFPSGWHRSPRSLTPDLADPREVLALGTGRLAAHPRDACAHMPMGALEALGPRDVLVTLVERERPGRGYPRRPARFLTGRPTTSIDAIACLGEPAGRRAWWRPFREAGRAFYLLVAVGDAVPSARLRTTARVVDGLRVAEGG